MNHDDGLQRARHSSVRPSSSARPSLDRPSLFAGMEDEDLGPEDGSRDVGILSTLASTRGSQRGASQRRSSRRAPQQDQGWQTKALAGLMGLGIVGLLSSFVIILVEGHAKDETSNSVATGFTGTPPHMPTKTAQAHVPVAAAQPASATHDDPLAALTSPQAATIESGTPSPSLTSASAQTPPLQVAATEPAVEAAARSPEAAAMTPSMPTTAGFQSPATRVPPHPGAGAATPKSTSKSVAQSGSGSRTSATAASRADEDVALVEAMLAHTGARKRQQ